MQKLITKAISKITPKLYSQEDATDPMVYAKFFHPYGSAVWLLLELDEDENQAFGFVSLGLGEHNDELGYFNIDELKRNNVERDVYFEPMLLSEAKKKYIFNSPLERRLQNLG